MGTGSVSQRTELRRMSLHTDCCVQNILLQVTEEGLGGCWMGIYPDEDRTQALHNTLNLPDGILPFAMISVGYGLQENRFVLI